MRRHKHQTARLFILATFLASTMSWAHDYRLTPANHPRDYSYYVCYQHQAAVQEIRRGLYNYRKIAYHGCIISKTLCKRRRDSHRRYFGWFPTYFQARNAFYRCAYRY